MHLRELDANLIVILDALLLEASVTRAAERLGRSPSAVSHALARLREIFDDPLFVRAGQRLVPTSHANHIAPTVHIIVSGLEGLLHRQNIFDPAQQQRRFFVGCGDAFELTLLPQLRSDLAEHAPGIVLERQTWLGNDVQEDLRSGKVHFALTEALSTGHASDISMEKLFDDPYVILASGSDSMATQKVTENGVLAHEALVIVDQIGADALGGTPASSLLSQAEITTSPLLTVYRAMECDAVALVPHSIARLVRRHINLYVLETKLQLPTRAPHLLWHVSQERDECHAWMRDRFRQALTT